MKQLIGENKVSYLLINYVDTKRISQEKFDTIIALDVTKSKKFAEWIINQYVTNPSIEDQFGQLSKAIKAYIKFNDLFKEIDFKSMSVDEFINQAKSVITTNVKPEVDNSLQELLNQYSVGTILGHNIYVIPKGEVNVSTILNNISGIPQDIVEFGTVIYVVSHNSRYVISFAADVYVNDNGENIPIKNKNVDLWDNIFTHLYENNYVQEDIIACIDLFGDSFSESKLSKVIEQNNPKLVFGKYYSNPANKLINLVINTNSKSISDYSKYVDKFKNLGFGLKGTLLSVDLGAVDIADIRNNLADEEYESRVKAHFKRTGESFDSTTFTDLQTVFNKNGTLYFILLRDAKPDSGIFIESGSSIIGFLNKTELSYFMGKIHSARKIESILSQMNKETNPDYSEYESQLTSLESDVESIIDVAKLLKHYIIL